jgi:hypothetical protein
MLASLDRASPKLVLLMAITAVTGKTYDTGSPGIHRGFFYPASRKKEIKISWNLTHLILTPGLWQE